MRKIDPRTQMRDVRIGRESEMLQAIEHTPAIAMPQPVVAVGARYNGPPGMGNGGFTAGLLSRFFEGAVEVTLRRPVPLDRFTEQARQ